MVYAKKIKVMSNNGIVTFHNVTTQVKELLKESGIQNGTVTVYSHHTTCCVITQEAAFDMSMTGLETLQQDFVEMFEQILPTQRKEGMYLHPGPKALKFAEEHDEDARGLPQYRRASALRARRAQRGNRSLRRRNGSGRIRIYLFHRF